METIVIIGAGFSGTMVAVHMLRMDRSSPLNIVLVERTGRFTAGVAYATNSSSHLLNVPAGRMSAFEDDPGHFLRWAQQRDASIKGGTFIQRRLYGKYLADVLDVAEEHASPSTRLLRVPGEARSIRHTAHDQLTIDLGGGGLLRAGKVVLAIGNFPPADPPLADPSFYHDPRYAGDPWSPHASSIAPESNVLLVGTGLTMLDIALALEDQGHRGTIYALSRRGLLPQPHRHSETPPPQHNRPQDLDHWPRTAVGILRALRNEVRSAARLGVDWREVVTSIRHDTAALWQSLPRGERARFLRHLRPFWETHRHRAAPNIAARIDRLIKSGRLRVIAGRVIDCKSNDRAVDVTYRKRGRRICESLSVSKVINCTGPDTNLACVREPLIQNLHKSGLIRIDSLGLGLDADSRGAIISAGGKPCRRLFLVGPLRKGQLWENTAVPELRIEAASLAAHLTDSPIVVESAALSAEFAMQC